MPAPKQRYYSTRDIMRILGISKSKANAIMHMFEYAELLEGEPGHFAQVK